MSLPDLVQKLVFGLRFETDLVRRLATALGARRSAWIAVRPGQLAEPLQQLERLTEEIAAAGDARQQALEALAAALTLPPTAKGRPRALTARNLADHLPPVLGAQLQQAADAAQQAGKDLRTELLVGSRLLQVTQRAHEGLLRAVITAAPKATQAPGYTRGGRRLGGMPVGTGTLIDGRL